MATPQNVFDWFESRLGDNGAEPWNWYFGGGYVNGNVTPYCACTVSKAFNDCNVQCEGFPRAVAIDRRDGFANMVEPEALQPGDAVGFDWDNDRKGDHVGVFKEWIQFLISFWCYEGNTSGGIVDKKVRYINQVTIGVRPHYDGSYKIAVDGACGRQTVSDWQTQCGTTPDGVLSGQLHSEDRYRRNVWAVDYVDSGSGSTLIRKVQRFLADTGDYHGTIDGCWGGEFSAGMQRRLKSLGYYTGEIDKDFGHHSVEALQMSLNDGKWS